MTSWFLAHRPHPALRGLVTSVVGYRQEGLEPGGVHRGLPSPALTLVVPLDEPLDVAAHPDPAQEPGRYDALLGGLHTAPALIRVPGRQSGLQVALTPLGARRLLGVPAGELAALDVELADVLGSTELVERVRAAGTWDERFAAAEDVLRRQARAGDPAPEVAEAWRLTVSGGGRLRVAEVARRVGWSPRHLTDRFRAETGLAPKEAARVVRFDRARRALAARPRPDLAGLAAAAGYADQAHLAREWRAFTGLSPLRWLSAERGFVQDTDPPTGSGSAA